MQLGRLLLLSSSIRVPHPISMASDFVPRAEFERLQGELEQTQKKLADALATLDQRVSDVIVSVDDGEFAGQDKVERAFDEVDANGDGVLTLEEFRVGYALLTGDAVAMAFDAMDTDCNGTLDKDEFKKGFALLTSDSARAEAEREKVEDAVREARIAAVKEAAKNIAEAQLMDSLFNEPPPGGTRWPENYKPVSGRAPVRRPQRKKRLKPPSTREWASVLPLGSGAE